MPSEASPCDIATSHKNEKNLLGSWRFALSRRVTGLDLMGFALGDDCRSEPRAKVVRKFVEVGVAVNFDGHLGCVADHVAVVAPLKMVFQFGPCLSVHRVVKIIR